MIQKLKNIVQRCIIFAKVGKFIVITPHRLEMLQKAIQYVTNEKVPGAYFEFGVARGLTFSGAYLLSKKYNAPITHFHAFDSFEGFPELGAVDSEFVRFETGDEKWSTTEFETTLRKAGVQKNAVSIHPGWFKDSLTEKLSSQFIETNTKASLIWIDCDLYTSTKEVLDFITPLLQNGTVVVFDDWFCYHADPAKGERRALAEYLEENTQITFTPYKTFGIVGNSFIVTV